MVKRERIVRASARAIQNSRHQAGSLSDWPGAEAMSQSEIERLADEEDGPLAEGWESTVQIGIPEPAKPVHIRLDASVLRWFKSHGPGYQTRINAVLRAFVEARERSRQGRSKPQ